MATVVDLVRERFGELTEIQKLAIPKVLNGENVLILAPTGSGKTEACLLPVLEKIKENEKRNEKEESIQFGICALYITPLRALSRDLKERFNWWCERLEISHNIRTGDTTASERTKQREKPPKILLTTIESLQALLMGYVMRKYLANIKFVIVDEVHDILDNKRGAQLSMGLERLAEIANFQRIGISATVADEDEAAKLVFGNRPHAICEAGKNRAMNIIVENIEKNEDRLAKLKELTEAERALLFVNTRSTAEELGASLKKADAPIEVHHGSLAKEVRLATEDQFKAGTIRSLICTSSLELGIDIGDVTLAIQYGSPHQVSRLIQRVGRSGHSLHKIPRGITFPADYDDFLESEVITIFAKNGWIEGKKAECGTLDVIAHQLVGLCLDFGRIDLSRAHNILSRSYAYSIDYEKLRKIAIQLFGEGLIFYDEEGKEDGENVKIRATQRARIYYSNYLSTIPKTKRFLMREISSNKIISNLDEEFVVNLEVGACFLSHGKPWQVMDITANEVLATSTSSTDIIVPSWSGEDIPVPFEVAQEVGRMRKAKSITPLPDDKTVVLEIIGEIDGIGDLIILHCCYGTKINEGIARIFAKNLSRLLRESARSVSDPYRIFIKLPFPLKQEYILHAFNDIRNVRVQLGEALSDSSLLRSRFHHVARMFGLLAENATVNNRYINALRNSVVYEETVRTIFFRYFDIERTERILREIKNGKIKLVVDIRKEPSYFAKTGLARISKGENLGGFEPRKQIIAGFKENTLAETLQLVCLNCSAIRILHLASASEIIKCHKCGQSSLARVSKKGEANTSTNHQLEARLVNAYGKRALIALATYGIGAITAERILRKLHPAEDAFYMDLIEAQKLFVKNRKYWKI